MNLDMEVCAYIIRTGDISGVLNSGVRPEVLFDEGREIFEGLLEHFQEFGGLPSQAAFEDMFDIDIRELGDGKESLRYYVKKLKARQVELAIREGNKAIAQKIKDRDPEAALSAMREVVAKAASSWTGEGQPVRMSDLKGERISLYKRAKAAKGVTGFRSPWPIMDEMTGGFQPKDLIYFAAKRNRGKTWTFCKILSALIDQKVPTLVISREMPNVIVQRRIVCIHGRFPPKKVRKGRLSKDEEKRYLEYEENFWEENDDLVFAPAHRSKMLPDIEALMEETGCVALAIDGIHLLDEQRRGESRSDRVARISEWLAAYRLRKQTLVLGMLQFNRDQRIKTKKASLDNVSLSDGPSFDADHFFAMTQDEKLEELERMRMIAMKVREGEKIDFDFNWKIDETLFDEIGTVEDTEDDYESGDNDDEVDF